MTKTEQMLKTLSVDWVVEDRLCVVVGGGRAALDPVRRLLVAGARVRLVAPWVRTEIEALLVGSGAEVARREFVAEDVDGARLVFAATGSRSVNRTVLACSRERGVACSCIDGNWYRGDFTVPAEARHGALSLAVATGGHATQYARMVRDHMARHMRLFDSVRLVVIGTDHRHLSVEEREPLHLAGARLEHVGFMVAQVWGIHEFMLLNTCNRVEMIAVVAKETAENGILQHVMGFGSLSSERWYQLSGYEAFEHLCLVTAGMLSQTPGERHVTAQVKDALRQARARGWAGGLLQAGCSAALRVSKAIKQELATAAVGEEIEVLALRRVMEWLRTPAQATLFVLGSGVVGRAFVEAAWPVVGRIVWGYHARCPELPEGAEARVERCSIEALAVRWAEADVVVGAADAPEGLLRREDVVRLRSGADVLLVDLGMPRNFDPALADCARVVLWDLDGLKRDDEGGGIALARCRSLVAAHREGYDRIMERLSPGDAGEGLRHG